MATIKELEEFQEMIERRGAGTAVAFMLMDLRNTLQATNKTLNEIDKTLCAISQHVDHVAQVLEKK